MKYFFIMVGVLLLASLSSAAPREELEQIVIADLAKSLAQIKTPSEALEKMRSHMQPQEIKYFEGLINKESWGELPTVESDKNTLVLKFSNNMRLSLEITNYWKGEFALNGYKLEMDQYSKLEDRMAYLRRVIQSKVLSKETRGAKLFSLLFPSAQASLTCNSLVSSGCMEVSMAASLWLVRTASSESPLSHCRDIYYFNKNNDTTKQCLMQYKNNPTITTVNELSELLAAAPDTSVEISCNKGEGPDIRINGSDVVRIGNGYDKSDYAISLEQDKQMRLKKLPELAIRCCQKKSSDPLAGACEEFVAHQLGSKENRKKEFADPNIRLHGKELKGIQ